MTFAVNLGGLEYIYQASFQLEADQVNQCTFSWMPHICGMDTYGMKIMPQMSGIATFQDIYGMLIFEDEHAIDV